MPDLKSAKEWVEDIRKRKRPAGPQTPVAWMTESEVAEIQRNALAAAAKAVCLGCADGPPRFWDRWHDGGRGCWCHKLDADGLGAACKAVEIWKLIPQNPAPARKDEQKPKDSLPQDEMDREHEIQRRIVATEGSL